MASALVRATVLLTICGGDGGGEGGEGGEGGDGGKEGGLGGHLGGGGKEGGLGGGGAGQVETVPSTPSVRVVGQEQTVPPVTWTFGPTDPTDGAGLVGSVLAVFPLMVHNEHDNEIATVPPAT